MYAKKAFVTQLGVTKKTKDHLVKVAKGSKGAEYTPYEYTP